MTKQVRVTAVYNKESPIRLYVLALIELARQLQRDEEQAKQADLVKAKQAKAGDSAGV